MLLRGRCGPSRLQPANSPPRSARFLTAAARPSSIDGLHRPLQPIQVVAVILDPDPHLPGLLWLTCPITDGFLLQIVQELLPLCLRPPSSPTRRVYCSLQRPYHSFSPGCIWSLFNYRSAPTLRTKKGPCDRASIFFHRSRCRPSASRPPCQCKILLSKKSFRKKCKRKMEQESEASSPLSTSWLLVLKAQAALATISKLLLLTIMG
ncbi:uncharacterized protein LOC119325762 isoform X4 [Triticum dicoccoides]|uniref:uncharacterized protein LOC119325762 isoform X4 n=1 Tax=Triticum dicoccoides TaxID=85692 RepID=UPI001891B9E7|nr:uncharacterized protein LOC119325762 isoform X4 [Triticum dicoccoides]